MDAHGGEVGLTSTEGEGTTFHVRLPIDGPPDAGVGSPGRRAETVI